MYQLAEHSSLTGSLTDGGRDVVEKYNLILDHLTAQGIELGPLFPRLPEDASFDRVGVAAKLLDGYLTEDEDVSRAKHVSHGGPHVVIGNVSGLEELKDLGKTIRENIAEALSGAGVKIKLKAEGFSSEETPEPAEKPTPMPDMSKQTTV
jgi:hypothetical protein